MMEEAQHCSEDPICNSRIVDNCNSRIVVKRSFEMGPQAGMLSATMTWHVSWAIILYMDAIDCMA